MSKRKSKRVFKIIVVLSIIYLIYTQGPTLIGKYFPIAHMETILKETSKYNINPLLVASVIRAESSFNQEATSKVGAVGLMQIMPNTGVWIAGKMGIADYNDTMLLDPEVNIAMGVWFLDYLTKQYDNYKLVLAAYNAGKAKVDGWVAEGVINTEEGYFDDIPYPETKNYLTKIDIFYKIYKIFYPGNK